MPFRPLKRMFDHSDVRFTENDYQESLHVRSRDFDNNASTFHTIYAVQKKTCFFSTFFLTASMSFKEGAGLTLTRGCHPDSEDPQTDTDQEEEEGDGIASSLIVKISSEIWA